MRRFGFHHFGRGRALGLVALIGSVVSLAVLGALPVEAGTASTAPKPEAPGTGAPLLLAADVGSSITPPAGLYPAKPPAPDEGVPLHVPTGVGSGNTAASAQGLDCYPVQGFKSEANDRYVVAQLDYGIAYPRHNLYGMLRAHATGVGPWERFQFCYDKRTTFGRSSRTPTAGGPSPSWTIRLVTNTCFAPTPQGSGYGSSTASSASLEAMGRSRSTQPQATGTWQPNLV